MFQKGNQGGRVMRSLIDAQHLDREYWVIRSSPTFLRPCWRQVGGEGAIERWVSSREVVSYIETPTKFSDGLFFLFVGLIVIPPLPPCLCLISFTTLIHESVPHPVPLYIFIIQKIVCTKFDNDHQSICKVF